MKPPYAIGSVPSLSGHAIAYRWRSLPRVRRHRASKPQGSSERVLPWQVTMDQLICASPSHTHYWYEVGMLKVPASIISGRSPSLYCTLSTYSACRYNKTQGKNARWPEITLFRNPINRYGVLCMVSGSSIGVSRSIVGCTI